MPNFARSKLFWAAAVPLGLVGLYALLGFKVAPKIARDQAQAFVREHYARELAIGEIRIQPFKLQVEVRDLALPDSDGKPMLGFERLFVDFELSSLWNRAYTFKDVTVEAPAARVVVRPDGSLNLADLALPQEEPAQPTPSVWVQSLTVDRGAIEFTDEARKTPLTRQFQAVGFGLQDFRTTPDGGDFSFTARSPENETFEWKGRFAIEPVISSEGEFRLGNLQAPDLLDFLGDARPFHATRGTIGLEGTYRIALDDEIELAVNVPTIELKDFALRARSADADWVQFPSLLVAGTSIGMPAQDVKVEKIVLDGLAAQAWMNADGSINLQQMLDFSDLEAEAAERPASPDGAGTDAAEPAAPSAPARPWNLALGGFELTNATLAFEDRSSEPFKKFDVAPVNLRVADITLDLARPLPVQLDAIINGHARFDASGTLTPEPLAAAFDISFAKARMQLLQPWVLPVADLTIDGGELNVTGKAALAPPDADGPEITFTGDITIDGFRSVDNALKQDLVNFERLSLSKVSYAMAPDALSIDTVTVRKPYARVIISEEQVINIAAVLDPQGTAAALESRRAAAAAAARMTPAERRRLEKEREAAAEAEEKAKQEARKAGKSAPPAALEPAPPDTFPIRIGVVRIEAGRMNFSDNFVQPNFSADVQALSGTITGLSSAFDSRARVDLAGKLGEFSPVSIAGELQPFAFDRYTDIGLKFENISLPILNPYSTPLAGYAIAKGKLTTDLHYRIENRNLDAQHRIRVDQLEWGEATATQGEATLPVKFATALLKDRHGVISLDVPVAGTLDDPTFRIGPIVWQVIKNIIVKAVTAPFALLGSLFAGAEDAQFVDFAPGEAALDATTTEQLGALAQSLAEKPELKLDVPIGTLPELDRPAIAERGYRSAVEAVVAQRHAKAAKKGAALPAFDSLGTAERIEVLSALVEQQTGAKPRPPAAAEPPDGTSREAAQALREAAELEYLEKAARSGIVVSDTDLEKLGEQRAGAVEAALLGGSGLEPTRVFKVRDGKVTDNGGKVRFQLGLQ